MMPYASVKAKMVEPERAPIPTLSESCTRAGSDCPMPENRTIIPSGTPPRNGNTIDPMIGAYGVSSKSSEPSPIYLEAFKRIKPYTHPKNISLTNCSDVEPV